jgi:predicted HTH transcriptional regulator
MIVKDNPDKKHLLDWKFNLQADLNFDKTCSCEITSNGSFPNELTKDVFFNGYSISRNKELIRIYKDFGMAEQLGSGVTRILQSYDKKDFIFSPNFFHMSFETIESIYLDVDNEGGVKGRTEYILTKRQNKVLSLIKDDSTISYKVIAMKLDINESTVINHIAILKNKGIIFRRGSIRGGH